MNPEPVYRLLSARMPYHAGNPGPGTVSLAATRLAEPGWWREQLDTARRLHGRGSARVLGTIRWYSASSVLLAPVAESLAVTGIALDPSLAATTLSVLPDGRLPGARSGRVLGEDVAGAGRALGDSVAAVVEALASAVDARPPALWAIATDSLANRLLWAAGAVGSPGRAEELAAALAEAAGDRLPRPRYVDVGASRVVRRASCCLMYEAGDGEKCTSCPRQHPDERERRIRRALG